MRQALWILVFIALRCAAAPPPKAQETKVETQSEEEGLRQRFEAAYFEIACMANKGVDPLMTYKPLKRPIDYLQGLAERNDPDLPAAMKVLQRHGFASVEVFKAVEMRLRADRTYWNTVDARFVDELLKCK